MNAGGERGRKRVVANGGDKEKEREREKREILKGLEVCNLPRKMNGYDESGRVVGVRKEGNGKLAPRLSKSGTTTTRTGTTTRKSSTSRSAAGVPKKKDLKKDATKKDAKKTKKSKAGGRTDRVKAWDELRKSRKDWSFGKRMGL